MGNIPNVPSAHPTLGGRGLLNAMSAPTTVKINFSTPASPSNKRLASDGWICDMGEAFSEQAAIEVPGFRGVCVRFGWSANHAAHGRDRSLEGSSVSFGKRQVKPAPAPGLSAIGDSPIGHVRLHCVPIPCFGHCLCAISATATRNAKCSSNQTDLHLPTSC